MDVTSESEDSSIESNYEFLNFDFCDCPCSIVTSNQWSLKFNWNQNIWRCVSIFSAIVSVACLVTLALCMTGNSNQGTTASQEINNGDGLHQLKKSTHQDQKQIAATQKRVKHTCLVNPPDQLKNPDYNETKKVTLECGGLIPLPPAGASVLLVDYKSQESYKKNEKCLWIFHSANENDHKCYAKIKISVLCEGFGDEDDEVFVFDWIDWERLTSFKLSQGNNYSPSNSSGWQFLSFTSTNNSATVGVGGTGFILRLEVIETSTIHLGTNLALTQSAGTVTYGPSKERDRFGIVFNPPWASFLLILDYLESQGNKEGVCQVIDSLHIFLVGSSGSSSKLPLLCGTLKKRIWLFEQRVLVAFLTSRSETGQGFGFSWTGAD